MVSDEQLCIIFGCVSRVIGFMSANAWQPENVIPEGLLDNRVTIVQQ